MIKMHNKFGILDIPEYKTGKFLDDQDVEALVKIQNRRHHKKRINKKLLKKYGSFNEKRFVKGWQANAFLKEVDRIIHINLDRLFDNCSKSFERYKRKQRMNKIGE